MRYFLICDDSDTLSGMRLAGIDGVIAGSKSEVELSIDQVVADSGIAVMLITEKCADMALQTVSRIKLSAHRPLVVVIPGSDGDKGSSKSITDLIRDAIGIKI